MTERNRKSGLLSRHFACPGCGSAVRIPLLWVTGIESVFRCRKCGAGFGTGYRMGAVLFAVAFTLAVTTVNLLCYLAGSWSLTIMFFAAFPLWLAYGFVFRKAWMVRRAGRRVRAKK
ncbi:MAG: hypothetical protein LUE26_12200 [Alistipes sp.]|nr:hypothetical protein [Alistipes sp.]